MECKHNQESLNVFEIHSDLLNVMLNEIMHKGYTVKKFLVRHMKLTLYQRHNAIMGNKVDHDSFQGSYRTGTGSHSCGCVYASGQWVLTAGHCGGSS